MNAHLAGRGEERIPTHGARRTSGFASLTADLRIAAIAVMLSSGAHAQPDTLYVRTLAANCAQCHGTDGHAASGSELPTLAGMPRESLLAQLNAFKAGTRPSTIMGQIAKGYSEPQLEQLAAWFAAQKK